MIFNIGIILILLMFTVVGLKQGIIKQGVSLIGIILVFVVSFLFKGLIGNLLCLYLPFFNFIGNYEGLSTINILIYQLIGFIIIFSLLLSVYALIIKLSKVLNTVVNLTLVLIIPSKILGAILGFIEGYILVFICIIILIIPLHNIDTFTSSKVVNYILYNSPVIRKITYPVTSTIKETYVLGEKIAHKKISKEEANKKILDTMLEHKVVSKSLVQELIEKKKIKI